LSNDPAISAVSATTKTIIDRRIATLVMEFVLTSRAIEIKLGPGVDLELHQIFTKYGTAISATPMTTNEQTTTNGTEVVILT
jgi:hypothetical protein